MKVSDLFATANAWHGGMLSALYSFASTETIHGREHKIRLLSEIVTEIGAGGMDVETLADERQALDYLAQFVQTAPIGTKLSNAIIDDNGRFQTPIGAQQ